MGHTSSKVVEACKVGDTPRVRRLLSKLSAAQVRLIADTPRNARQTPLHWAADNGYLAVAEALVSAGAAVDAKDTTNVTPLHIAAKKGHTGIVELLLAHGASVVVADGRTRATPLHLAARKGHTAAAAALVQHGAPVDAHDKVHRRPLHYAAANGHAEVVRLLIKRGATVDSVDNRRATPLHLAAEFNVFTDTVEALIEHGADISAKDGWGRTPAAVAAGLGFNEHVIRAAQTKLRRHSRTTCDASTDADSSSSDDDEASVGSFRCGKARDSHQVELAVALASVDRDATPGPPHSQAEVQPTGGTA